MNKRRRIELRALTDRLVELKEEVRAHLDDEQDYFDNMPEAIQLGSKGDMSQTAIDAIDQATISMDEAFDSLQEATGS